MPQFRVQIRGNTCHQSDSVSVEVKQQIWNVKQEGRKSRFQKIFWFGMMGLGRLIRSVTNSRRKRNYKKSKDLIERKTKQKKDKKKKELFLFMYSLDSVESSWMVSSPGIFKLRRLVSNQTKCTISKMEARRSRTIENWENHDGFGATPWLPFLHFNCQ